MDIDELRAVQTKERQKDSLQHLRDSFYEDVAAYIQDLKSRRTEAADVASDPFSDPEVSRLTDEIETAEDVVEAIYERRVGKVVKLASFAAADMPVDEEGLTVQERDLFEDLVGRIDENKDRVLDILAGEGDSGAAPGPTGAGPAGAAPGTEPTASESTPSERSSTADPSAAASSEEPDRTQPAVATEPEADHDESQPSTGDEQPAAAPEAPPDEPPEEFLGADAATDDEPSEDLPADDSEPDARGRPDGGATEERTTVRITADVGRVLGMDDREYELRSDDVVSLPEANADALLEREAAEEL